MFEQDIEQEVCLPWKTICRLAVMAMISGVSLNDIAVRAIESYIFKTKGMR